MLDRLALMLRWLRAVCRLRSDLALENLALRQQLTVLSRRHPRPRLTSGDRFFWVMLRRVWVKWTDPLIIVKPDTVVGWHRAGFRLYWRFRSRVKIRVGRPRTGQEIRDLIHRMAAENGTWGAPRIHGELLKLGVGVSERTVSRYLQDQPRKPASRPSWLAFLRNHREAIAAMDLFTVPTVSFRLLYVFFVISHARRQVLRADVTEHPTAGWITQQLREAFPDGSAPKYLLLDRDSTFDRQVLVSAKNMNITPVRTGFRSPWQNGVAERWVESCRRDVMDHVLVFNERHARRLLAEYLRYYHEDRTHYALAKDSPLCRAVVERPSPRSKVVGIPRVGGLHHRYEWSQAA
jgi:putative transposase